MKNSNLYGGLRDPLKNIMRFTLAALLLCGSYLNIQAQCAKFEPSSGCLFIIGQDLDAVGGLNNYTEGYVDEVLDTDTRETMFPAGVTTYTDLTYVQGVNNWTDYGFNMPTHAELYLGDGDFDNSFIVIGIDQQAGQLDQVANGQLDGNIDILAAWVKRANRPVFLRYGYEFNGQHNGYNATTYKNAYRHFKDRMDANGVTNAAYVWQAADESEHPYELSQYYPGDEYVDWCGISRFWSDAPNMISFARSKNKPVMIAEATPKGQRVEQNSALWDTWYQQVINLIRNNNDVIKAFAYINQDWDQQPIWQNTFGNSDLSDSEYISGKWLEEFDDTDFYIYASSSLFDDMYNPDGCVNADFEADQTRIYTGETVTFENRSNGDNTQNWSFGAGASPSSAQGDGPHAVTYNSAGEKTITLTINSGTGDEVTETKTAYILVETLPGSCLIYDEFDDGDKGFQRTTYNSVANPAFETTENNGIWSVTAPDGYDGFVNFFHYILNDGSDEMSYNLDHESVYSTVTLKVRASAPCALRVDMEDRDRISTDDDGHWNKIELTTDWQEVTIDFDGHFYNNYGCGGGGQPCGNMDQHFIESLRFYVNPGWNSQYFYTGKSGTDYDEMFEGDIEFEYIKVGQGCGGDISPCISKSASAVEAYETVDFSSCSSGEINSFSWDFGDGASPSSAIGEGPHEVSWDSDGAKVITLTITGNNGSKSTTTSVNVSSCQAIFQENFSSIDALDYTGGAAAFTYDVVDGALTMQAATGHDEWDYGTFTIHNGNTASPIDMGDAAEHKMWIKAKASGPTALRVNLVDSDGEEAQTTDLQGSTTNYNSTSGSFNFPLTTEYVVYEIDFTDQWWDEWVSKAELDISSIAAINLKPNPAWNSFPIFGFTEPSEVTISIDWIQIGSECGDLVTGVETKVLSAPLLYPNPATDYIRVEVPASHQYVIFGVTGQVIESGYIHRESIDVSTLEVGSYFIRLTGDNSSVVARFVKQ